ncbi:MAG: hypothetical protein IJ190_10475 [Prevotella sp.]|nr:hypothetical protein [Prevotella sp.]
MQRIDFSKITVLDIEGKEVKRDISRDLGNILYYSARDIAVSELGKRIYHDKEIDVDGKTAKILRKTVQENFTFVVVSSLLPVLDSIADE